MSIKRSKNLTKLCKEYVRETDGLSPWYNPSFDQRFVEWLSGKVKHKKKKKKLFIVSVRIMEDDTLFVGDRCIPVKASTKEMARKAVVDSYLNSTKVITSIDVEKVLVAE